MLGLYVHIPFCETICTYCDFTKRIKKDNKMINDYLEALMRDYYEIRHLNFNTIYIGGGTPSMLTVNQLEKLFKIFENQRPIEYTIEINPESYTEKKGLLFKRYNINRISLGIQTFNETILASLNRKHTNKDVFNTLRHLINIGLYNINIDMMFSLPKQTMEDLLNDLKIVNKLPITHISYYNLILEEKTVLYHDYLNKKFVPNNDELEAKMYNTVIDNLLENGFTHYEVSNFHKGNPSFHNIIYWTNENYHAIGAGAHGFYEDHRYNYTKNVSSYILNPIREIIPQTEEMNYQDTLIFGLRLVEGINLDEVYNKFKREPLKDFPKIENFIKDDLLEIVDNHLRATRKGLLFLNQIELIFV
ncbi:MAG: radical SAM family heme chaperone HemW [Acholeplasmatales bacterium]